MEYNDEYAESYKRIIDFITEVFAKVLCEEESTIDFIYIEPKKRKQGKK